MTKTALTIISALLLAVPLQAAVFQSESSESPKRVDEDANADHEALSLPGIYNLRGQMETASGLRLNEDGSFDWYIVVGGLDVIGKGIWSANGDMIDLVFQDFKSNDPEMQASGKFPVERMALRREGSDLLPTDGSKGAYIRAKPHPKVD